MRLPANKDLFFLSLIGILLFIFYPDFFLAKSGPLIGDHLEQHYPWAYLLSTSLKQFHFPFWTSLIHCGFPIAAESQIAIFYLPNLIFFFLLPFHWAYSYITLFHFWIAGWGTYQYARQMKLIPYASFVAAIVFLFGTSYGGAYYNITSLKTISWFPLVLFLFEKFNETKRKHYLWLLSVMLGSAVVAGYMQVAVFMILIFLIYACMRIFVFSETKLNPGVILQQVFWIVFALVLMVVVALPQLLLTFELAVRSNRATVSEDYAYIGSMSPLAPVTLLIPYAQGYFSGNSIYVGVFSVLLILCSFFSGEARKNQLFRIWILIGIISLLLALGQWSPVYVALIKLSHFYSFRTPMKFIIFACFSLAMLSGIGFHTAWNNAKDILIKPVAYVYFAILAGLGFLAGIIYFSLTTGREVTMRLGHWFIDHYVYGKVGHPHSLEIYYERLWPTLEHIWILFSFKEFWNLWTYALLIIGAAFCISLLFQAKMTKKWLSFGIVFLIIDLYGFSWCDIRKDFDQYEHVLQPSAILQELLSAKSSGQLGRIYGLRSPQERLPLTPSINMFYEIEDVGAYSPFVLQRYFEVFGFLGNINDSNWAASPDLQTILARKHLLDMMDVSHVLSKKPIDDDQFELVMEDLKSSTYLYQNKGKHQRAFFVSHFQIIDDWGVLKSRLLAPDFDPYELLLLEKREMQNLIIPSTGEKAKAHLERQLKDPDHEVWNITVSQPGFFVISNIMYPGWHAKIDGKTAAILKAYGLFQAIWIPAEGNHEIDLRYHPLKHKVKDLT